MRFVFLRKRDESGKLIRHKARLVVRGFMQGDVEQTFELVVDFKTIRTCLSLTVQRGYCVHQMDVRTAFLHGEVDGDVYVKAPDGIELSGPGKVPKHHRGLYGLKQAPGPWQDKWQPVMENMGFSSLISDSYVYRRRNVWLILYVDDIILMGDQEHPVSQVKRELDAHLDVKDLGVLRFFFGIVFERNSEGAWLTQSHYILQVLESLGCPIVNL